MNVKIYTEKEFERQLRKLSKKYRSMLDDYDAFLTGLEQDPYQGTSLGKGVRKVRMAIARVKVRVVVQGSLLIIFTRKEIPLSLIC
mgnify:CR=1 FL=1